MKIEEKHGMTYVTCGDVRYQIFEEDGGGVGVRLVEDETGGAVGIVVKPLVSNTVVVRADRL